MTRSLTVDWIRDLPHSKPALYHKAIEEFDSLWYILQFEADRRAFIITINSFGTELSKEDRAKLYPRCGRLYPDGLALLGRADDYDQVRGVAESYAVRSLVLLHF